MTFGAIVLVVGLYVVILWQEYRIRKLEQRLDDRDAGGVQRDYDMAAERVILRPERNVESWALTLWDWRCHRRQASRAHMTRRKVLSAHGWNEASALLRQVGVDTSTHTYEQGVTAIRAAEDRYHRLAEAGSYVAPYGQPY